MTKIISCQNCFHFNPLVFDCLHPEMNPKPYFEQMGCNSKTCIHIASFCPHHSDKVRIVSVIRKDKNGCEILKLMQATNGYELYVEYPTCQQLIQVFDKDYGDEIFLAYYKNIHWDRKINESRKIPLSLS